MKRIKIGITAKLSDPAAELLENAQNMTKFIENALEWMVARPDLFGQNLGRVIELLESIQGQQVQSGVESVVSDESLIQIIVAQHLLIEALEDSRQELVSKIPRSRHKKMPISKFLSSDLVERLDRIVVEHQVLAKRKPRSSRGVM